MLYHAESFFSIAFGGMRMHFNPKEFAYKNSHDILRYEPFAGIKKFMNIEELVFLRQVHGNSGFIINDKEQLSHFLSFEYNGDFILTDQSTVGIGIATADCLPIVLYSPFSPVVGIVHAGWRGSVGQVVLVALEQMLNRFNIKRSSVRVFFGPSAKRCCYSVGSEVTERLKDFSFKDEVLRVVEGTIFFDLPLFNILQLQEAGIRRSAINVAYNLCTLCNTSFCSYRRQKDSQRQMTVVSLR